MSGTPRSKEKIPKLLVFLVAVVAALLLSCLQHGKQSFTNLAFNLGFGRAQERNLLISTIRQYTSATAGLYATGGYLEEFRLMPADNLLKRKHFQNVEQLVRDHTVMVFDQDKFVSKDIRFYGRNNACVITSEQWLMAYQDMYTRKKLSNVKGEALTVRYMMRRQNNKWLVSEVEVFPSSEPVAMPSVSKM